MAQCCFGVFGAILAVCAVGAQGNQCQEVIDPICEVIGYNQTLFPNYFGHRSTEEAHLELSQFEPLIKIVCSEHLRLFLCSLYNPVCTILDEIIPPCYELCEATRQGCEPLLNKFNLAWPAQLDCSPFPRVSEDSLCVVGSLDGDLDS